MTRWPRQQNGGSIAAVGDAVPEPLGFNAFGPEYLFQIRSKLKALGRRIGLRRDATRAPVRGPEWQGAASKRRPPQTQTQTRRNLSLLHTENGLDNGGHFKLPALRVLLTSFATKLMLIPAVGRTGAVPLRVPTVSQMGMVETSTVKNCAVAPVAVGTLTTTFVLAPAVPVAEDDLV